MISVLLASPPPKKEERKQTLPNLGQFAGNSKEFTEGVVDPLKDSVNVAGAGSWQGLAGAKSKTDFDNMSQAHLPEGLKAVSQGLGVAGSTLGGVYGIHNIVEGVREGDKSRVFEGATDITTSAGALASLGLVGGAAVLAPAAGVMLGARGLQRLGQKDPITRLDGATDILTAAVLTARLVGSSLATSVSLGILGTGCGIQRGLHRLKKGHETGDPRLSIKGTGELTSSFGVALIATGVGVAPGVGLILLGAAFPLLQRVRPLRSTVNKLVKVTDRVLYPVAVKADRWETNTLKKLEPVTHRVGQAAAWTGRVGAPVFGPIKRVGKRVEDAAMRGAQKGLHKVAELRVFKAADSLVGKMRKKLLPPPDAKPPAESVNA